MVVRASAAALCLLSLCFVSACSGTKSDPKPADEICNNGVDDDGNGKSDCADAVCFRNTACTTAVELCGNGVDDDSNGKIDCADSLCASEAACASPKPEICEGGADEDGDGKIDCADTADCSNHVACRKNEICNNNIDDTGDPLIDCGDPTCNGSPFCPSSETGKCSNTTDDDGDLAVDCQDADCALDSACGTSENNDTLCSNGTDDDGDFLSDCQDGSCLSTLFCRTETACQDGVDNDKDTKIDCSDSDCAATSVCMGLTETCNDQIDNDGDQQIDCLDVDCDQRSCGVGCVCSSSKANETECADGSDNDRDGLTDCTDTADCAGKPSCNGASAEIGKCGDGLDNDNDNLTDCADTADCPNNAACGTGCICNGGAKKETMCGDTLDNDFDQKADCADADCLNVLTETCGDGKDNDCDGAIDCADTLCSSQPSCTVIQDGSPCVSDAQCAGGKCLTEALTGTPGGACSNSVSCNVTANTGCNGGRCVESGAFDLCRASCTGTGVSGAGACRAGFACYDPDSTTTNGNNYCRPMCTADSQCTGAGTNYGCNPWSKLCESKDKALTKYGGPCSANSACESGICAVADAPNDLNPGGYCRGLCNKTVGGCGGDGFCFYDPSWGDNVGVCYDGCTSSAQCRTGERYSCQNPGVGANICYCRGLNFDCSSNGQCCSGRCDTDFFFGTFRCY